MPGMHSSLALCYKVFWYASMKKITIMYLRSVALNEFADLRQKKKQTLHNTECSKSRKLLKCLATFGVLNAPCIVSLPWDEDLWSINGWKKNIISDEYFLFLIYQHKLRMFVRSSLCGTISTKIPQLLLNCCVWGRRLDQPTQSQAIWRLTAMQGGCVATKQWTRLDHITCCFKRWEYLLKTIKCLDHQVLLRSSSQTSIMTL